MSRWVVTGLAGLVFMAAGCILSTADLSPQGRRVAMVPSVSENACENLGPVFGKGGGSAGGGFIADEHIMEWAANDLRNHAAEKGATHVVFSGHQMDQSTATMTGIAYRCGAVTQASNAAVAAPQ